MTLLYLTLIYLIIACTVSLSVYFPTTVLNTAIEHSPRRQTAAI